MSDSSRPHPPGNRELIELEARYGPGLWAAPLAFVRGQGARLWDADGKEYLDCMAGIAVASLGHAHPRLVAAIAEQAQRLIVCPQNLANDVRGALLEALVPRLPEGVERVFFTNSGAEANEAALKWARVATGRSRLVAARRGFAGRTMGALSLTWEPAYREPFAPLPYEVDFVPFNDQAALEAAVGDDTAVIWLEPVQGEGGVHVAEAAYLRRARELASERGALLALDEIQTGVGRTGRFLALEHAGVAPDLLTLAKGLAGGVPIGALAMTAPIAAAMPKGGHGTTFGGNPLACAAALAVLQEIDAADLLRHVQLVGSRLREGLEALGSPLVRSVRGVGLMLGIELVHDATAIIERLREAGVLVTGAGPDVIRFLPPLVIDSAEVDEVVMRVGRVLAAASS